MMTVHEHPKLTELAAPWRAALLDVALQYARMPDPKSPAEAAIRRLALMAAVEPYRQVLECLCAVYPSAVSMPCPQEPADEDRHDG